MKEGTAETDFALKMDVKEASLQNCSITFRFSIMK